MSHRPDWFCAWAWVLAAALPCCAHTRAPVATAESVSAAPLAAADAAQARARVNAARSPARQVSLTAKTSRFGSDGRQKATLQLVLRRPNQFRITVLGPHGPPLYAVACDGARVTALDVGQRSYSAQPATPAGIARYLGGLDVGLQAQDWVDLILGDMDVPADAEATSPSTALGAPVVWHWQSGFRKVSAAYDGSTGKLTAATLVLGDGRQGTVTIKGRSPGGVAEHLVVHLSGKGKEGAQDLEMVMSDVQELPGPLADEAFSLVAPEVPAT